MTTYDELTRHPFGPGGTRPGAGVKPGMRNAAKPLGQHRKRLSVTVSPEIHAELVTLADGGSMSATVEDVLVAGLNRMATEN